MNDLNNIFIKNMSEKNKDGDFRLQYILNTWPQIVGYEISKYSFIKSFEDGVLTVIVNNSPFMHEIKMMSPVILDAMNKLYGEEIFKKIKCLSGSTKEKDLKEAAIQEKLCKLREVEKEEYVPLEQIVLPKEVVDEIDASLQHISKPELKELLRKTAISLRKKKYYMEKLGYWNCKTCGTTWSKDVKSCIKCDETRQKKKIVAIKKIIIEKPNIDFEEMNEHLVCTMEEMNQGRLEAVKDYAERMKCENPPMEDRYKLVMILQHKEQSQLNDGYVLKVTDKYLPYEYRKFQNNNGHLDMIK